MPLIPLALIGITEVAPAHIRIGRKIGDASRADDVVDAVVVDAVKHIERFKRQFEITLFFGEEAARQAHIESV